MQIYKNFGRYCNLKMYNIKHYKMNAQENL